jgi:hypothetical protein
MSWLYNSDGWGHGGSKRRHWQTKIRVQVAPGLHAHMGVSVYVSICMYVCTDIHTYIHTCMHACIHMWHLCMHVYICDIYACMHTYVTSMHACIHMWHLCMHVCMYVCLYIHTYMSTRLGHRWVLCIVWMYVGLMHSVNVCTGQLIHQYVTSSYTYVTSSYTYVTLYWATYTHQYTVSFSTWAWPWCAYIIKDRKYY